MIKIVLFFVLFSIIPPTLASGNISVIDHGTINEFSVYTLEARDLPEGIIGISATFNLTPGTKLAKYEPGKFFENNNKDQVSYLISSKKNNPQKLILGIASLGSTSNITQGTIVRLYFSSDSKNSRSNILSMEDTLVSGLQQNKRIDYSSIQWQLVKKSLAYTGSNVFFVLLLSLTLSLSSSIFKKGVKVWYTNKNTKNKNYVPNQKKDYCTQKEICSSS